MDKNTVREYNIEIINMLQRSELNFNEMISVCCSTLMSTAMEGGMPVEIMKLTLDSLAGLYEKNFDSPPWGGEGDVFEIRKISKKRGSNE